MIREDVRFMQGDRAGCSPASFDLQYANAVQEGWPWFRGAVAGTFLGPGSHVLTFFSGGPYYGPNGPHEGTVPRQGFSCQYSGLFVATHLA